MERSVGAVLRIVARHSKFVYDRDKREQRTSVDEVHAAHGTAGVVENPFLGHVPLGVDVGRVALLQLGDDGLDDLGGVVAAGLDAALGDVVQLLDAEDVEALEVALEHVHDRVEDADQHADKGEKLRETARRRGGIVGGRHGYTR